MTTGALAITPPGPMEWVILLVIVVLLFGAKKLPDLGSAVGRSIKNFKSGVEEGQADDVEDAEATDSSPAARDQ